MANIDKSSPANLPALKITGNVQLDGLILKVLFGLATPAALWAASKLGSHDNAMVQDIAILIVSIVIAGATAIFGWIKSRIDQAIAVRAGVNLTASGNALMTVTGPGAVTPLPVTPATAPAIVKNFGKAAPQLDSSITDTLNAAQLTQKT